MKSIEENPEITPTQLSEITLKDKTTITRMIDTLVKNEMLLRTPKKNDRRAYQISWSTKGEKVMQEILPITGDVIKKLSAQFNKDDLKIFFTILEKLRNIPCLEKL